MATPPPDMGAGEGDFPPPDDYPPPPEQQAEYPPPPDEGAPPPEAAPPPAMAAAPPPAEPAPAPAGDYPPPPPAKKSVGGLGGVFLKMGDVGGGILPIIFTLVGFVLWGVGHFIIGASTINLSKTYTSGEFQNAYNLAVAGNSLAGIGAILALFGIMVLLLMIYAKKK